jgi:hypothetical protein
VSVHQASLRRDAGLACALPDKTRELKAKLAAWRDKVHAAMPKPAEPGKADAEGARPAKRKRAKTKPSHWFDKRRSHQPELASVRFARR